MNRPLTPIEDAVIYALRCGCFFPVPELHGKTITVRNCIKRGAIVNLHNVVAKELRASGGDGNG